MTQQIIPPKPIEVEPDAAEVKAAGAATLRVACIGAGCFAKGKGWLDDEGAGLLVFAGMILVPYFYGMWRTWIAATRQKVMCAFVPDDVARFKAKKK